MREIEFRAWLEKIKMMVEAEEINFTHKEVRFKDYGTPFTKPIEVNVSFEDVELMQCTGKKDKNGTKIFEHDLIQLDGTSYIYEIVWDNESSSYKMQNKNDTFEWDVLELRTFKTPYITVIGNIYENPELLENE